MSEYEPGQAQNGPSLPRITDAMAVAALRDWGYDFGQKTKGNAGSPSIAYPAGRMPTDSQRVVESADVDAARERRRVIYEKQARDPFSMANDARAVRPRR